MISLIAQKVIVKDTQITTLNKVITPAAKVFRNLSFESLLYGNKNSDKEMPGIEDITRP